MSTHVLYHNPCNDGFGAALSFYNRYKEDAYYHPVEYGSPMPEIPDEAVVFIVDFSYPMNVIEALCRRVAYVTILDHHATAKEHFSEWLNDASKMPRNLSPTFDMNHSGAMLAWKYLHPTLEPPMLLKYVEDRDLWRWNLPSSKEINAYIMSKPMTFDSWNNMVSEDPAKMALTGTVILSYENKQIEILASRAYKGYLAGYEVPVVNTQTYISGVCHKLVEDTGAPFSVAWFAREDKRIQVSLRSIGDFDVGAIAKRFGGGGHKNAAGFEYGSKFLTMPDLIRE